MARKMKKFSAGGAQGRYDRRMADIEKDRKIALAKGKNADVAEAKAAQRIADAKDDLAKRTGADRTATRAAERAAESNLTKTRKYGAPKAVTAEASVSEPKVATIAAPVKSGLATAASKPIAKTSVKTSVKTPVKTPVKVQDKSALGTSNLPSDQGFSSKSRNLKTNATKAEAPKKGTAPAGPSTKTGLNPNSIAARIMRGDLFKTSDAFRKSQEAKYGKAKGGKVKKENTMKYRSGGSTPPQPTPADRARSKKQLDSLKKAKTTPAEGKVVGSANRSEGPGYKKGGKMATKFGAAMKKKSADTKGRAMMKFAKGGSIDGCAVKGKTKTSMIKMKKGGSC